MNSLFAWIQTMNDYLNLPQGLLMTIAYQENGRSWKWNQNAISPRGAKGVMQIMPNTVTEIKRISGFLPNPYNIIHAMYGAGLYLKWLNRYYDGDWRKAIAAYNYGLGNVNKIIRKYGYFEEGALPNETKNYMYVADTLGL